MPDGTTCVTKYYGVIKHIYQQENIKLFLSFVYPEILYLIVCFILLSLARKFCVLT